MKTLATCLAVVAFFVAWPGVPAAVAANATWNGTTDANWATIGNWSASPVPGVSDTATFNNAGNGHTTISLGGGVPVGNILFDTASVAAYTIGSGGVGSQTLTLSGSGSISMNSTVASNELFNANLVLSTANGNRTIVFNNNSGQSLTLAGGMTTINTGTKTAQIGGSGNVILSGNISDGSGKLALTVSGTSPFTLTLSGNNTYTGQTTVNGGALNVTGPIASTANTIVGNAAGNSVLGVSGAGTLSPYYMLVGNLNGAAGAVYQTGGTVTATANSGYDNLSLGNVPGSFGYYDASAGSLTVGGIAVAGEANNGTTSSFGLSGNGILEINGGTVTDTGWLVVARNNNNTTGSEMGVVNVYGGSLTYAGGGIVGPWDTGESAIINILGGTVSNTVAVGVYLGNAGDSGILNLNGGVLTASVVEGYNGPAYTPVVYGQLDFNGGTLQASAASGNFIAVTTANIYSGGATINDNGTAVTVAQPLLAPSGNGVHGIASFTAGAGYIAPPIIVITNGVGDTTGSGATAIAQIDRGAGTVTNLIITCPGVNYTATPGFVVSGGGATTAATITGTVPTANGSGGLVKAGAGTLTLSGANTYTGGTIVSSGTLALTGSLASSNIVVNTGATFDVSALSFALAANQGLAGSGTVTGSVATVSGSKIYAGTDGTYGTNTFNNNLTFVSGANAYFDLGSTAAGANDKISLNGTGSTLTCGGANIGIKCGATLDQANDYILFKATGIVGGFNLSPVWTGTTPANASAYSIVTVGNNVLLHYSTGGTNPPAVTNLAATSVQTKTATLNGQILSTGGQYPTVKVYYGPADGGTNAAGWSNSVSAGLQGGVFAVVVSNLTGSTTYYFTAYATNSAGAVWAQPSLSFITPAVNAAVVTNFPASNVQGASAILNGQVVSIGSTTPNITLYYGTTSGGTNAGAWANSIFLGAQSGGYAITAMGLATNTTYYFTAAAANSDGTFWAQTPLTFTTLPTATQSSMLTFQYNNARVGANTNETLLVPSLVNTNSFGRLIKYVTDGYIYTQPLYVPNVVIPGQGTHNVVYVASEHDTVYAFDADGNMGTNGGLLWKTNLGISALSANGEFGARYCLTCYPDIVPEVGVTGTPVIDPTTGTLYVNVFTREVSSTTNYIHRLHALNITNGTERPFSPVVVSGYVPGTGVDSVGGVMTFNAKQCNQRSALTLAGGIVYIAYAGYADTDPYHGWILGYNATNLALVSIINSTPNATTGPFGSHAAEGGVWMSGSGLCVDANTNLYFETGNGSFSANTNGGDYADSIIKLSTTNGLAIADYFTPFDQATRSSGDLDLSSAGVMLLPDEAGNSATNHLIVGGSKGGTVFLLNRDNLGKYNTTSDSQVVQEFAAVSQIYDTPAYFNHTIYNQYRSGVIKAYAIANAAINTTASSQTTVTFSGYGDSPVISANGTNNAILWAIQSDAFASSGATILHAYNATNLALELYNSGQLTRDSGPDAVKMTTPTVVNGKVYVGGQMGLSVYGFTTYLATPTIAPNGATYTNSVVVTLSEATPGATIYYTLDGTVPTTNSLLYTAPFTVTTTLNVTALAVKSGAANSGQATASFINTAALGTGGGLLGQYWTNTTAVAFTNVAFATPATLTRTDAVINFNWSPNGPATSIGQTNFTARWTGSVQPQYSETYTFTTVADDGVRLWANGQLLINDWTGHTTTATNSGAIALNAQQLYNLRLEYFQNTSNAVAQLLWSGPSTALGLVPQTQLYTYTNPPPTVVLTLPASGATYTEAASVTLGADADAPYNPVSRVDFYANGTLLGTLSNSVYAPSYFLTKTGLTAGGYALTAVATDGSGLASTSAPVSITVNTGTGQPYGLTTNGPVTAFLNMPTTFGGTLPALLSASGVYVNTASRTPNSGLIPYTPNTPLWSDAAVKSRYLAVPNNGGPITPDQQIAFTTTNYWTFPAGTVFVKNFDLVVDETNTNTPLRRLETRLIVRDINGAVYGVTYKWRPDNSDADLLTTSLSEAILITNVSGVRTQTWYYPSPADCLTCHTPQAGYVLGVNTRQLNGSITYAATGTNDNQLRTLNRLGLLYPAFNETNIAGCAKLSALTDTSASLEQRARSYLDANCAQCHRPGNSIEAAFDARYDTPPVSQNITNALAQHNLGIDGACVVKAKDIWRSVLYARMNTATNTYLMPPLARSLIDSNAVQVVAGWINSLAGTPALAPVGITPNGGTFTPSVSVALTGPDTNASLYYTLDGTLPTTNSLLYNGPLLLLSNLTLTASAYETNYVNSAAASALFSVLPVYFTSASFATNGQFQLGFLGSAGQTYVLQASTNLVNWVPLNTNVAVTNVFQLIDPGASNYFKRFYRAVQQ